MAQQFLLSAGARSLSAAKIMRMSDSGVETLFLRLRWPETDGKPVCPDCGGTVCYAGIVNLMGRGHRPRRCGVTTTTPS